MSAGYSPLLTFEVEDLDSLIPQLIQHGAVLDGNILREPYGATASLRAPDGHMIGLHERAGEAADEIAAAKVARALLDSEGKQRDTVAK